MNGTVQIFLSYARENVEEVESLYDRLSAAGFVPWMDTKDLLPGERWQSRLRQAIQDSDFFLVCLSEYSVDKRGWIQRETRLALDVLEGMLESDIYIIPARLCDCELPDSLRDFQRVDLFEDNGFERLIEALQVGASRRAELVGIQHLSEQMGIITSRIRATDSSKETTSGIGLELVHIPAGWFLMGSHKSDPLAYDWEKPQHRVYLDEYWISKYPVTNAQFREAIKAGVCEEPGVTEHHRNLQYADYPVVGVTWYQAMTFARWLGGRLPSEPEWEKAARGTDGREYPWGDRWDRTKCNSLESGILDTTPVGHYSPQGDGPFGCGDMAGNVWEWTLSLWGNDQQAPSFIYPYAADDGREQIDVSDALLRVVRGGAFHVESTFVRCAFRYWNFPSGYESYLGFRVVVGADVACARDQAS